MLIAQYLFSMIRSWMGSTHPAAGAGATGTSSGQVQQPGTVAEPAAPAPRPVTTVPTETTQIGLVIEGALGSLPGQVIPGQGSPMTGGAQIGGAHGALSRALGAVGSAQARSVVAAQLALYQTATGRPFDATDLAALASLADAAPAAEDEAKARALAENAVLSHRRAEWLSRISDAAGPASIVRGTEPDATAAVDAARAIFAALVAPAAIPAAVLAPAASAQGAAPVALAQSPTQAASKAAHRGYGQALALFG